MPYLKQIFSVITVIALLGGVLYLSLNEKTISNGTLTLGASTFPTTLNDWDAGETIESAWADAVEAKIGVDGSAVTTSLDYKVRYPVTFDFVSGQFSTSTLGRFTGGFIANASSTIAGNFRTHQATTTGLAVLNLTSSNCDVKSDTSGNVYCGTDSAGGTSERLAWELYNLGSGAFLSPTTTVPIIVNNASSTIYRLWANNLYATSSVAFDGLATFGNVLNVKGTDGLATSTFAHTASTTRLVVGTGVTPDGYPSILFSGCITLNCGFHLQDSGTIDTHVPTQFRVDINNGSQQYDLIATGMNFAPDNTLNIGAVLATRPKNIFLGNNAYASSTGSYFGGLTIDPTGQLVIPQGTAPTVDAAGEIAEDTTTNGGVTQLIYGASGNVLTPLVPFKFWTSTTTLIRRGSYSTTGTTTLTLEGYPQAVVFNSLSCRTDPISGNGTTTVVIGKGSTPNNSQFIVADDRPTSTPVTLTSNNTFAEGEKIKISFGNRISNADAISCSGNITPLRQ